MSTASPASHAQKSLVSLDPPEVLSFPLVRDSSPRVTLRITNETDSKIVFKVKTTQPSWYYVRPNQNVIDVGQTEESTITLIDSECNRFLDLTETERETVLSKHRFLVQTRIISDTLYDKIVKIPQNERTEEYQKIWETKSKDEKRNQKLKVEFIYPDDNMNADGAENMAGMGSVSEGVENIRSRMAQVDTAATPARPIEDIPGSPDGIYAELQNLRKKYDAVVEYTVHLTAERDYHFTQLEELRREYSREKARKRATGETPKKESKNVEKVVVQQGFSFLIVVIVAVLSFIIARYTKV